jgi:hypothetical protein
MKLLNERGKNVTPQEHKTVAKGIHHRTENKWRDSMKIEIKRGTMPSSSLHRYNQDVYVDGEFIGYFRPWYGEYHFRDKSKKIIDRNAGKNAFYPSYIEVYKISEMVPAVSLALELGEIPTDQDIADRQAKRDADEAKSKAEEAEDKRIWLIKDHAVELLDALETIVNAFNRGGGSMGDMEHAEAIIAHAKGDA